MITSPDNRKFPRVVFDRALRFKGKSAGLAYGRVARDLSQGGIRFNSDEFFPLGGSLAVQVQLADGERLFDLEGKVGWVRKQPHAEGYHVGLEFVGGPSFEKWKIAQFVAQRK